MLDIFFFVWMITGSNPLDINRFRMNTRKFVHLSILPSTLHTIHLIYSILQNLFSRSCSQYSKYSRLRLQTVSSWPYMRINLIPLKTIKKFKNYPKKDNFLTFAEILMFKKVNGYQGRPKGRGGKVGITSPPPNEFGGAVCFAHF